MKQRIVKGSHQSYETLSQEQLVEPHGAAVSATASFVLRSKGFLSFPQPCGSAGSLAACRTGGPR